MYCVQWPAAAYYAYFRPLAMLWFQRRRIAIGNNSRNFESCL